MLLRLNWKWRSTVLDILWVRRRGQSHPECPTVRQDKQKLENGDKTEIHTSKHNGTQGFTGAGTGA